MSDCPFCVPTLDEAEIVLANDLCLFLQAPEPVLIGSGIIVPRQHRITVFDLKPQEWQATYDLLQQAKALLDKRYQPEGYNVGWNCGAVGGQVVFHAHLHVIPRFADEPYAGRGIRHWLKQDVNRRTGIG
jgi:diadenosine tetraphosphate (Ap4A) HIT family hydrolase